MARLYYQVYWDDKERGCFKPEELAKIVRAIASSMVEMDIQQHQIRYMLEGDLLQLYNKARSLGIPEVYVTIPDYPDDYHPGNLWEHEIRTNIERTLENIADTLNDYPDVNWLIPIQGHNEEPESILYTMDCLKELKRECEEVR